MLFNNKEDEYNKDNMEKSDDLYKSNSADNEPRKENTFFEGEARNGRSHYYEMYKDEKSKKYSFKKVIAACLVVSLVGGGSIGAGYSLTEKYVIPSITSKEDRTSETASANDSSVSTEAFSNSSKGTALSYSSVDIVSNAMPSVVSINTKSKVTQSSFFGGYSVPYEATGAGSGVIYSEDDTKVYIATNEHVISGASEITVSLEDKDSVPATVIGSDKTSDLAVISVLKSDMQAKGITYKVASFGDSDSLQMGQNVIAIGNALGEGKTSTGGMISAKGKTIEIDGKKLEVIQTDAAINPGNSGGALLNYDGEVVGINTAKAFESSVEGMGYAIPSNVLKPIIQKLIENGSVPRPYLGIVGSTVTDELGELYGLPIGVVITQVMEGGSAANAGLKAGDIITDFAGEKIIAMDKLVEILAKQEVGKEVEVRIIRDGKEAMTKTLTIQDANLASQN